MKEEISSLDLFYLTKEFQELTGGRIDKIYQEEREFVFIVYVPSKGKKLLKIKPNLIYLTDYKEEFPDRPGGFCQFLRKYLGNSIIRQIRQHGFERILEITAETKEKKFLIILELFAKGNLILCDEEYKILSALESHKWKDRTVRGGIKYEFPPVQVNTPELSEKKFAEIVKNSDKDSIVKTLAVDFTLGGLYSEEVCLLSNIDKSKKKLTAAESKELYAKLKTLFSKKISAIVSGKEITPFELKAVGKGTAFESFSKAIDSVVSSRLVNQKSTEADGKKAKEIQKIMQIISQQEETIKGMDLSAQENQKKGEHIYENYAKIKTILEEFNGARKKYSWEELKEILKKSKIIKQINEKEGTIVLEL